MSHQVSQQKAGEGILLQLETNKDCCPFCSSAKGIYAEDRLTDVFAMQDNDVVSCYFHCNLPVRWSDQWHVYLQAFVTAKLLAVSMLSTWGTKLKGASDALGLVLWRKIANRKAVYSWSVFLMKRPPTKNRKKAKSKGSRMNYLQATYYLATPSNCLSQSCTERQVPKTLMDKELIIFVITTAAFKSLSSIDFNFPDAFMLLFWLLSFQPFIHKYSDLSWLRWPFKVFSLHLPDTEHTGKSATQQPLTLSARLIKGNDAFWI